METPQIHTFSDPAEYLVQLFSSKKSLNPRYSIRAWAKQLGYQTPAYLAQVLKGERKINLKLVRKISSQYQLSEEDVHYFNTLVLMANAKSQSEKEILVSLLNKGRPKQDFFSLDLEAFRFIADWYHLAILEMFELEDFTPSVRWIAKRICASLPESLIEKALSRMEKLKLIESKKGKLKKTKKGSLLVDFNVPSEAVRAHHEQMMLRAQDALANHPPLERDIRGTTLSLRKENLDEIQKLILELHMKILKYGAHGDGDETYQLNTQLFKLTKKENS